MVRRAAVVSTRGAVRKHARTSSENSRRSGSGHQGGVQCLRESQCVSKTERQGKGDPAIPESKGLVASGRREETRSDETAPGTAAMKRAIARRSGLRVALTLTLCVVARDHRAAGQLGKIFGRKQEVTYQTYRDSSGRFSLEYPNKDWRVVPGGGSAALVILARADGEATVSV